MSFRGRACAANLLRTLLLSSAAVLLCGGVARAQPPSNTTAPPYAAQPPTEGALYQDGQSGRYLLGGTWLSRPDLSDVGVQDGWWQDVPSTAGWSTVTVPNAYNAGNFTVASMDGWVEWYRRDFTVPSSAFASWVPRSERDWIVRFESVNYRSTVWLNGREIGSHVGAFLPFELKLAGLRPGVNRLIVRVDNRRTSTDLPPGPGGLWFNYGGILREVYLRAVQVADMPQVVVRPLLPCPTCSSTVDEQVLVRNVTGSSQTVSLTGTYGKEPLSFGSAKIAPGGTWTAEAAVEIAHPHLWSIDDPYLYRATLRLTDSHGRELQSYFTYSGIRSIQVTPTGRLELNGRLLNLRGVDLHEQNAADGAALDPAQQAQLITWARAVGAHLIRAHYPLGPEIEEMADRDGILIWSEVPVYQLGTPALAQPSVISQSDSTLKQNILDNENHPSVLLWSIGNELPTPVSGPEARYIAGAAALAHQLDPTRPVGLAISSWPGVPCQAAYGPLNVIGYNDYFGWFDAGGGGTDDRDQLSPYLDSLRACYPTKAIMITEFGFDANQTGPVEVRGTYAFQSNAAAFHLGVFASKPWLSGALYFPLQDFANSPNYSGGNPWPEPPWDQKGLIDQYGNLKPAFSVVASIFKSTSQLGPAPAPARRARGLDSRPQTR